MENHHRGGIKFSAIPYQLRNRTQENEALKNP